MAGAGAADPLPVPGGMAGVELAVPDGRPVRGLVPDGVAHAVGVDGQAGALVRAGRDPPVAEGGAFGVARASVRVQHGIGVVADVVAVDAAEERGNVAVRRGRQCDAATLAAVVHELVFAPEGLAAVAGPAVVDGRAGIGRAVGLGLFQVALVDPGDHDVAVAGHRQGVETVGDPGPVVVHGEGRGEGPATVAGAREAHVAGPGCLERVRPGDVQPALRSEGELGMVFAGGVDGFGGRVHVNRFAERFAEIVGVAQPHMARMHRGHPQPAARVERGARAQGRFVRHGGHVVRGRAQRQRENQKGGQEAGGHLHGVELTVSTASVRTRYGPHRDGRPSSGRWSGCPRPAKRSSAG